jgi:hypothetical protein
VRQLVGYSSNDSIDTFILNHNFVTLVGFAFMNNKYRAHGSLNGKLLKEKSSEISNLNNLKSFGKTVTFIIKY